MKQTVRTQPRQAGKAQSESQLQAKRAVLEHDLCWGSQGYSLYRLVHTSVNLVETVKTKPGKERCVPLQKHDRFISIARTRHTDTHTH